MINVFLETMQEETGEYYHNESEADLPLILVVCSIPVAHKLLGKLSTA